MDQNSLGGLWSAGQWSHELTESQRLCLGCWDGDRLIAMACGWLVVDELQVTLVAVHPQHRRRGLGTTVLEALLCAAAGRGATGATLEVDRANSAARALYARLGFRTAGVRRGYYRDGSDALIQWAVLSSCSTIGSGTDIPPNLVSEIPHFSDFK